MEATDLPTGGVLELKDKTAFITGAASGIGYAITASLAKAGVNVMMCDINDEMLSEAQARISQLGTSVDSVVADISIRDEVNAAAKKTISRFGKIHILVNNAGVMGCGPYGAWSDNAWDWTIAVNMMGVVYGVDIFTPLIESHGEGGHIVNTASEAGIMVTNSAPYGASKSWLVTLSEGLRQDLASANIGVSVLCPGVVKTNILDSMSNLPDRFDSDFQPLLGASEEGHSPEEADVIRAVFDGGLDPHYVGELVREGITENWDYIMTDTTSEHLVEERFAAIKAAYDRIRNGQEAV
ncbi:MAG: SDR family NAD(P)-dependent oxidoreductase [Pseudomonadota bacterium]